MLDIPGIAVDSRDRIYVFSRDKQKVVVFNSEGNFIETFGEDFECLKVTARLDKIQTTVAPTPKAYKNNSYSSGYS